VKPNQLATTLTDLTVLTSAITTKTWPERIEAKPLSGMLYVTEPQPDWSSLLQLNWRQ